MVNYAYVKNGQVEKVGSLPKSFGKISGFDKANVNVLIANGWYPIEKSVDPTLGLDEEFGIRQYDIQSDKVVISKQVITRTLPELKVKLKQSAKNFVINKFQEEYPYAQGLAIALNVFGNQARTIMISRLNELVGVYQTFAGEVDACTTKAELLIIYNKYPQLQEISNGIN